MLRAAIVGCGKIAGGWTRSLDDAAVLTHAHAYRRHGGFELAACVDPDAAARESFAERWSIPRAFPGLADCLAVAGPLDLVSVCSSTDAHADALRLLLDSEVRAVFCEKPLTAGIEAARELVAAYRARGKILAVNHTRRWDPAMAALKAAFAAGEWGEVRGAVGWYVRGAVNNGSHLVDLIRFLLGPLSIASVGAARADGVAGDPTVGAVLRLGNGAPVHLVGGDGRDFNLFELQILAECGSVAIEDAGFAVRERRAAEGARFPGTRQLAQGERRETGFAGALLNAIAEIHDAVTSGRPVSSDGESALAAFELCEHLRRAAAAHTEAAA